MYLLKDFESEIHFRLSLKDQSLNSLVDKLECELTEHQGFNVKEVMAFTDKVIRFNFDHVGFSSSDYLKHPINVARLLCSYADNIDESYILLALVHNLIEVGGNITQEQLSIIPSSVTNDIEILTVDRSKQWDWSYKNDYYEQISSSDRALCIKIFDKLDNIFLIQENPDKEIRSRYIYEIESYLMPLAEKRVPQLLEYMTSLIKHCKTKKEII